MSDNTEREQKEPPKAPHKRGSDENANPAEPQFEVQASQQLAAFFASNNVSVLVTCYKSNLVFSFGATDTCKLGVFYSVFDHPMAIALSPRRDVQEVWIGCAGYIARLSDAGSRYNEGSDRAGGDGDFTSTLACRQLHVIGDQDVHGIYPLDPLQPHFVSTGFSALCQLDLAHPEVTTNVVWKPPFVSELKCEDRCHMNDVCVVNGRPKYASCVCESDAHDAWRDHRESGGVVIDIETNTVVARGLSMPHSPTWYRGELWILNSGTGDLGVINLQKGVFEARTFIPGFLRGLHFVGRFAVVGSSMDRNERRFSGLGLGKKLEDKKTSPVCGVFVVDLADCSIAHKVELKGNIHEVYGLAVVPGRRARVVGMKDGAVGRFFNVKVHEDPRQEEEEEEKIKKAE